MIEEPKEDSGRQIKMSEQSMTLMNNLGFNLCVAPQSLVMRLVTYFEMEGSLQDRGPREVE